MFFTKQQNNVKNALKQTQKKKHFLLLFLFKENNKSTQLLNSFFFSSFCRVDSFISKPIKKKNQNVVFFYVGGGWGGERERERLACVYFVCVCFSRPWIYYDYIRLFVLFLSTLSSIYLYSK